MTVKQLDSRSKDITPLRESYTPSNLASSGRFISNGSQDGPGSSQPASLSGSTPPSMHRITSQVRNGSMRPSVNGLMDLNGSMRQSVNGISQPKNVVRQASNWRSRRDKKALIIASERCFSQQIKWNNRLEQILDERLEQKNELESIQVQKSSSILKKGRRNATDHLSCQELLSVAMETIGKAENMLISESDQVTEGRGSFSRAPGNHYSFL